MDDEDDDVNDDSDFLDIFLDGISTEKKVLKFREILQFITYYSISPSLKYDMAPIYRDGITLCVKIKGKHRNRMQRWSKSFH